MQTKEFLRQLDHEKIKAAIRAAELQTSGEIRVFVSRKTIEDAVAAAQSEFVRLGMIKTAERNGVLIYVAPKSQSFAIIGDEAIHQKCGQGFWTELAEIMTRDFRQSDFTGGIVKAIGRAGDLLAKHFPRRSDDRNELSDDVAHD
jgi:uncharacterized membrane protein